MQERAELVKSLEQERANNSAEKARLQQAATAAQQRADNVQAQVGTAWVCWLDPSAALLTADAFMQSSMAYCLLQAATSKPLKRMAAAQKGARVGVNVWCCLGVGLDKQTLNHARVFVCMCLFCWCVRSFAAAG